MDIEDETVVVRGGKLNQARLFQAAELALRDRRVRSASLSVYRSLLDLERGLDEHLADACRHVPHPTFQSTTVGRLRAAGFQVTRTGNNEAHCSVDLGLPLQPAAIDDFVVSVRRGEADVTSIASTTADFNERDDAGHVRIDRRSIRGAVYLGARILLEDPDEHIMAEGEVARDDDEADLIFVAVDWATVRGSSVRSGAGLSVADMESAWSFEDISVGGGDLRRLTIDALPRVVVA